MILEGVVQNLLEKTDTVTLGFTAKAYQAIASSHSTELHLLLILYVAVYGIAVFQGWIEMTIKDAAKHILKVFIIFELATNWGTFTIYFYDFFVHGPEKIMSAMTGGKNPTELLGKVFAGGMTATGSIFLNAGTFALSMPFVAFFTGVVTLFAVGYALFLLIFAKFGLAILLSLGPIFIPLALWKSTEGIFKGWLNYLINFALIPVITVGVLSLLLNIMWESVKDLVIKGGDFKAVFETILPFDFLCVIGGLLLSQVNGIAASLGSGASLSASGAISRLMGTARTAAAVAVPGATLAARVAQWGGGKIKPRVSSLYQTLRGTSSSNKTSSSSSENQSSNTSALKTTVRSVGNSFSGSSVDAANKNVPLGTKES